MEPAAPRIAIPPIVLDIACAIAAAYIVYEVGRMVYRAGEDAGRADAHRFMEGNARALAAHHERQEVASRLEALEHRLPLIVAHAAADAPRARPAGDVPVC